ncbi:uncharacterized protein LOC130216241 [Danio aesculapii]|uniref:uncharacterized protein LOC130216241 n=1 Tax=Danio aesculapii TaxID=1142201 RepID=UPI0024C039E3|nr:uncharacterized protein LOC130216241 [Danio aesculapii]
MNSRLFPLILLLHIPDSLTLVYHPVSCNEDSICAVKGSQVVLKCSYYNKIHIQTVFWFNQKQNINWRKNNEAEDLTLDSDYSGRVKSSINYYTSELTISDVRERDSGEYQLMFIMKDGDKRLASVAVNLTVTVMHIRISSGSTDSRVQSVKLTCDSPCTFENKYYNWRKDGQYFTRSWSKNMMVSVRDFGSYSCYQDSKSLSSSVCVSKSGCWDVSYTTRRVCAVINSTVDISCTFSHPSDYTVMKTFWHCVRNGDFRDLREEHQFAGRVEFVENKLRIKELKISDSGEYQFRLITDKTGGTFSGSPGVILTVTDTQVISSPDTVSEGEKVILSCSTKCTLSNKHTYIWYKNGQQVTDGFTKDNKLYLDSVSKEELQGFSCAVGGLTESTALRNTAVVLCLFLSFALIGVLWFRWRRCTLFKPHRAEKEDVHYDPVNITTVIINASSNPRQNADSDNPDIHYSSIRFTKKPTSSNPTAEYTADNTETESVHYATVMFK